MNGGNMGIINDAMTDKNYTTSVFRDLAYLEQIKGIIEEAGLSQEQLIDLAAVLAADKQYLTAKVNVLESRLNQSLQPSPEELREELRKIAVEELRKVEQEII